MPRETHELAGKTVKLRASSEWEEGTEYRVEDYAENVLQGRGNPAMLFGMIRMMTEYPEGDIPEGDFLYGKIGYLGHLVHTSEILPEAT